MIIKKNILIKIMWLFLFKICLIFVFLYNREQVTYFVDYNKTLCIKKTKSIQNDFDSWVDFK